MGQPSAITTAPPPGFDRTARAMVKDMLAHGWTGRLSSKGHWIGRAPDGVTTISVPRNLDAPNRARQNANADWTRWKRAQHVEVAALVDKADAATIDGDPVSAAVLEAAAVKRVRADYSGAVITRPWLARRAPSSTGGVMYESEAVVEREHPDGRIDYVCALPDCGYESGNPRGVATHYGKAHTSKGETAPLDTAHLTLVPGVDYTEHLTTREYAPSDRLVDALAAFLLEQRFGDRLEARDLATLFLTWAHERPDLEPVEREPRTLTAEETLERIRLLAWSPVAGQVAEAHRQAQEAQDAAAAATAERDAIAARMVSVERDLATVREIMGEIGK
jgi:hypothetical protein